MITQKKVSDRKQSLYWVLIATVLVLAFWGPSDRVNADLKGELEVLNKEALKLHQEGRYSESIQAAKKVLGNMELLFGSRHQNHSLIALALHDLAKLYEEQGQYSAAVPLSQRALRIMEALLSPNDPTVAIFLNNLGSLYQLQGKYVEARPLHQRALRIMETALGLESPRVVPFLHHLGLLYETQGQYAMAEPLLRRGLRIRETALGPNHPDLVNSLNNLGTLYFRQGLYMEAMPFLQRALQISEAALGLDHSDVATPLNNLATLYYAQGNYAVAMPLLQRALRIWETAFGPKHPKVAHSLNNLGDLYLAQGKYAAAMPLYQRALRITEAALGPNHPDMAIRLNSLAQIYEAKRKYESAIRLMEQALRIWEVALGPDHPHVAIALNNLAGHYHSQRQYEKATALYQRSLKIRESTLGSNHPDVAHTLHNLAVLNKDQSRYAEAEHLFQRALRIEEEVLGQDHPQVAQTLNSLALLYGMLNRPTKALRLFQRGLTIETQFMRDVFSSSDETHQFKFTQQKRGEYHAALSLVVKFLPDNDWALAIAADLVLARKGLVHESHARTHAVLLRSLPADLLVDYQQWKETKETRGKLLLHRPSGLSLKAYQKKLGTLQKEIVSLESTLLIQNSLVANTIRSQRAKLTEIIPSLTRQTVLVEMVKFVELDWKHNQWAKTPRYVAFVIHQNHAIQLVDLGDAEKLDHIVRDALATLRHGRWQDTIEAQRQASRSLYIHLWQPLAAAIGNARTLIISPDGMLNLVPFAALLSPEGKFLIEDYTLMTVTSGRDLVEGKGKLVPKSDLFLAADPAFDWVSPSLETPKAKITHTDIDRGKFGKKFIRLKGTAKALKIIPPLVAGDLKSTVHGEQATEQAVVDADRPRILHLATHGFFLEDQPNLQTDSPLLSEIEPVRISPTYENPLVRSGLAFAGANHASQRTESKDGLLTAVEVTAMDLHSTDLVVLSACDTGTGEVRTGEGVYGLRRAFAIAGARNLVMSLWPVWDKQATKQMKTFYGSYGQGMHPAQALRNAQLERITWMRKYLGTAPPSLWAPFMVQSSGTPSFSP